MAQDSKAPTFTPAHVSAAFFIKAGTLRSWHALEGGGLVTDADDGATLAPGIKRRYSLADAIRIGMIASLSGADGSKAFNLAVSDAVAIVNELRPALRDALTLRAAGESYEWTALAERDRSRRRPWSIHVLKSRRELVDHVTNNGVPAVGISIDLQFYIDAGVISLTRPGIVNMSGANV